MGLGPEGLLTPLQLKNALKSSPAMMPSLTKSNAWTVWKPLPLFARPKEGYAPMQGF